MKFEDRVSAIADFGFTERQARFLVLVMQHAGVCVPRQYARVSGVAYGAKCNAFFSNCFVNRFPFAISRPSWKLCSKLPLRTKLKSL